MNDYVPEDGMVRAPAGDADKFCGDCKTWIRHGAFDTNRYNLHKLEHKVEDLSGVVARIEKALKERFLDSTV